MSAIGSYCHGCGFGMLGLLVLGIADEGEDPSATPSGTVPWAVCVGSAAETGACVAGGVPLEGPVTAMVTMPPVTNVIRETTTIKPIPSPPGGLS